MGTDIAPATATGPIGTDISEGISCPSSTRCFIVGGFTLGDGTPSGLVFTSSNGGNLWTSQSLPSGTTGLFGISCRTPTTCVVVGGGYGGVGGIVLTTTDAGETWTPRSEPAAVSGLQNVSCPTLDRCVATGTSPSAAPAGPPTDGGDVVRWWHHLDELHPLATHALPALSGTPSPATEVPWRVREFRLPVDTSEVDRRAFGVVEGGCWPSADKAC